MKETSITGLLLFQDKDNLYDYTLNRNVIKITNNSIVEVHKYWHPLKLKEVVSETVWHCVLLPEPSLQMHKVLQCISGLEVQVVKYLDGVYSYEALNYIQSRVRLNRG